MDIAFVGLGIMGLPMATNLVRAGHRVVGFNRSSARTDLLVEAGGVAASSIEEAVKGADVVVTVLPDSPDVELVVAGTGGVVSAADPDTLIIDMSTISPEVARTLSARVADQGLAMVDAPVSGGEQAAKDGALSIMIGGDDDNVSRAIPLLKAMGTTILHVGGPGSGQTVKAANQLLVAGTIELVAEALVFLDAAGVELEPAVEVLAGGLAGNAILNRKAAGMLAGTFAPGFRIDLHHKDLGIYTTAARAAGVFSPMGAIAAQLMGAMKAQGRGGLDHTALLQQVDAMSGRDRWASR